MHPGQWVALRILAGANPRVQTVNALAQYLGVVHSTAFRAVAALARKQLVTIGPGHDDRRQREIALTPKGRALLARDPIAAIHAAIDDLSSAQRREMAEGLKCIVEQLGSRPNCEDGPGDAG